MIGLLLGVSSLVIDSFEAEGAGLPPEEKPRLCDGSCEKELENVWWDCMDPLTAYLEFKYYSLQNSSRIYSSYNLHNTDL